MRISQLKLKGFRNFKNALINISQKTLIIGANDVGKSNMIYALRLLLDRSLSDLEVEPKDSDFYVHDNTEAFTILIKFEDVKEDCVVSKLKGFVSDDGVLYLGYKALKEPRGYKYYAGPSPSQDKMEEIQERYYRKVLHFKYISSSRDLFNYIRKEKGFLLKEAKLQRNEKEVKADQTRLDQIQQNLHNANSQISELTFINKSTDAINQELRNLSFHNENHNVVFDVGSSNMDGLLDNLKLSSKVNEKILAVGGDGRNNQIFLALWAARNEIQEENPLEVVFYCIEEPEAHLHPHQQRKLAEYLVKTLKGQVLITSHSPAIASEFSPNSIVRLLENKKATIAASDGCSTIVESAFYDFGYRLNVVASEAFFSNAVLLVEGPSEMLFYKLLARELKIDLDRLNISILMADGVGFETFVRILNSLSIKWAVRTDNDIFQIPKKTEYRFAGIQRGLEIYRQFCKADDDLEDLIRTKEKYLSNFPDPTPNRNIKEAQQFCDHLERFDIFISKKDLENDLLEEGLWDDVKSHLQVTSKDEALKIMQKRKASFMFHFLKEKPGVLGKLKSSNLAKPLFAIKKLIEGGK